MTAVPQRTRGSVVVLIALCAIAFALRVPGMYAHLPDIYWHDELNFVEGALRVGTGELVAAAYGGYSHGTLTYYVLFAAFAAFFVIGRIVGVFQSPDDLLMAYVTDPSELFLVARAVLLVASVATVGLTFALGRRLFGSRAGWLSGGLLAVSFQSVQITLGKEDGLYTLLVLATVWLAVRMVDAPATRWRLVALGGLAGAATAVKYFGALLVPLVVMAVSLASPLRSRWTDIGSKAGLAVGVCTLTFLCLVPGVLLDTDRFLVSFNELATTNSATLFTDRSIAVSPWYGYLWNSMALASGPLLAGLCYIAACWMLVTRPKHAAVLLIYPTLLFGILTATLSFGRPADALNFYQISALPLLFVAAGGFLVHMWGSHGRGVRMAVAATLVTIAATNLADDLRFQRLLRLPDSRTVARLWIEQHVPAGSLLLVEGAIGTFVFEGPQLPETEASLDRTLTDILQQGGGGGLWSAKVRAARREENERRRFDVHKVRNVTIEDLDTAPPYVVVRNDSGRRLVEADGRYRAVFSVQSDSPQLFLFVPMLSSADIRRLRRIPLFADDPQFTPGPDIRVYHLREDVERKGAL